MITVQPRREEALKVGFQALADRLPKDIDYERFCEAMKPWEVKAFCREDEPVGMLMMKGNELHVAVLPEVRGKWLSRRLIREVIAPIIKKHGEAKTSVTPENEVGQDFIGRLGFVGRDVAILRAGFANLIFDPVSAIVGGGAALGGALISADASKSAARTQANAATYAADVQRSMFDTINKQQAPYRQAGQNALKDITALKPQFTHTFTANDLKSNLAPNYEFQLEQGLGAVKNAGNLQTGLLSGNTLRGINDYAQNFAGNAYQQAFNNYNAQQSNIFNRLAAVAGLGQTANQTTANAGTTAAGNIGAAVQGGAAAQAAGTVGVANAINSGANNAASWYALSNFLKPGGGTVTVGNPGGMTQIGDYGAS